MFYDQTYLLASSLTLRTDAYDGTYFCSQSEIDHPDLTAPRSRQRSTPPERRIFRTAFQKRRSRQRILRSSLPVRAVRLVVVSQ
jgi:hypothetical protein